MSARYFTEEGPEDASTEGEKDTSSVSKPLQERKVMRRKSEEANETGSNTKKRPQTRKSIYERAINQATRYELFLTEESGFLEAEGDEETYTIEQNEIKRNVDIASASKQFELNLTQFGPYRINYTRNGKFLLLGGHRGHVAAFDWMSKRLSCEMNVMEKVNDVKWLHTENMFAVAQRKWVYVYDNRGVELHCLKRMHESQRLEYLPYHFLLAALGRSGHLHYLDISIGKDITTLPTKGRLGVMTQNPSNAVILIGHHNGTVTMWSPMMREPLVKMLCHKDVIRGLAVDRSGLYLATAGQDRKMKIFDVRMFRPVHAYRMQCPPSNLVFSQRGLLGVTCNNIVEVYKDPCRQFQEAPYLVQHLRRPACDLHFCPYEDVLGVGRSDGFVSLLVPGAGEANIDSLESNPYRTKTQRKEWEVKALLEKIQPDMITLDPFQLGNVDRVTSERLMKDKEERLGFKKEETKFEPKFKKKGKSSSGSVQKRKEAVRNASVREKIRNDLDRKRKLLDQEDKNDVSTEEVPRVVMKKSAISRFKKNSR